MFIVVDVYNLRCKFSNDLDCANHEIEIYTVGHFEEPSVLRILVSRQAVLLNQNIETSA